MSHSPVLVWYFLVLSFKDIVWRRSCICKSINAYVLEFCDSQEFQECYSPFADYLIYFLTSDLLHIFSFIPRDLNFIEHTSSIGWKEWAYYLYFHIITVIGLGFVNSLSYCNLYNCNYYCREQRARPIIIDPGLYHSKKSGVYWAKEKRSVPSSFKLFTGIDFDFMLPMNLVAWYFDSPKIPTLCSLVSLFFGPMLF